MCAQGGGSEAARPGFLKTSPPTVHGAAPPPRWDTARESVATAKKSGIGWLATLQAWDKKTCSWNVTATFVLFVPQRKKISAEYKYSVLQTGWAPGRKSKGREGVFWAFVTHYRGYLAQFSYPNKRRRNVTRFVQACLQTLPGIRGNTANSSRKNVE